MKYNQVKVIIIPGNGGSTPLDQWFPYVKRNLEKLGIKTVVEQFPDSVLARSKYWLPFIKELGADENTILIGYSSGAEAAMRFTEDNKVLGTVLVAACYTDLGIEGERISGYYDYPWKWEKIKSNQKWIIQFGSKDDPFIPIEEARFVRDRLTSEYYEFENKGHFQYSDFPELIEVIRNKL